MSGCSLQISRGLRKDLPPLDCVDRFGQVADQFQVRLRDQHGQALLLKSLNDASQLLRKGRGQTLERLVEQQEFRAADEGARRLTE